MNEYDSAKMADVLVDSFNAGAVESAEHADVLLLNTCSVREKAQEKVFSLLGRWRRLKEERPDVIIGVGGCVASQEGAAILKRAPFVDLVFGPQTLHRLPAMIREVRAGHPGVVDVSFPAIEKFDAVPAPTSTGCSAFLSVMEGCSKACTYCIVPTTRGEEISRPLGDVLAEARRLADLGALEITLLGQNVNAYQGAYAERRQGRSRGLDPASGGDRRRRAHPLHDLAPGPLRRRIGRGLCRRRQARELSAPARAERVGSSAQAHEARLHRREVRGEDRQAQASAARHLDRDRHDRRLPGRDRAGLRGHARAHAARGLRPVVHLYI